MKITYQSINNFMLMQAFQKLAQNQFKPKVAYKIMRLSDWVATEAKSLQAQWVKLCEKYAEKDEKGASIKDGPGFKIKDDQKEIYEQEFRELMEIEIETPWDAIAFSELGDIEIAPTELKALEPFLIVEKPALAEVLPLKGHSKDSDLADSPASA